MSKAVFVSVPASSGNLGPGFDVLGMALTLRNEIHARVLSPSFKEPLIRIIGEGNGTLPRNSRNVIFQTMRSVFKKAGKKMPALELICVNRIPLARGLGSSSAAYLSALLTANKLLKNRFSYAQILDWATKLEGHPDNVAPALYGGVRASGVFNGVVISSQLPVPSSKIVVAIPRFELSTKKARKVLPKSIPMADAISNLSSVALLPAAFSGKPALLSLILNDRMHEPYRAKLIPGFWQVKKAALMAGAHGVILSGAGPTMLAFADSSTIRNVSNKMEAAFRRAGVIADAVVLQIDKKGAQVK